MANGSNTRDIIGDLSRQQWKTSELYKKIHVYDILKIKYRKVTVAHISVSRIS